MSACEEYVLLINANLSDVRRKYDKTGANTQAIKNISTKIKEVK